MGAGYDLGVDEPGPVDFDTGGDVDVADIAQVARRFGAGVGAGL